MQRSPEGDPLANVPAGEVAGKAPPMLTPIALGTLLAICWFVVAATIMEGK